MSEFRYDNDYPEEDLDDHSDQDIFDYFDEEHDYPAEEPYEVEFAQLPQLKADEEVDLAQWIEVGLFAEKILARRDNPDSPALSDVSPRSEIARIELEALAAGGREAKAHFVAANQSLVAYMANCYAYRAKSIDVDELIQQGNLGLIRAVEKFDFTLGNKFSTYAWKWIRVFMFKYIRAHDGTIYVPETASAKQDTIKKFIDEWTREHGVEPNNAQISAELGYDPNLVSNLRDLSINRYAVSVDDQDNAPSILPSTTDESSHHDIELSSIVEGLLGTLQSDRARTMLRLVYGLGETQDGSGMSYEAAGIALGGVKKQAVHQLHQRTIERLRKHPDIRELARMSGIQLAD